MEEIVVMQEAACFYIQPVSVLQATIDPPLSRLQRKYPAAVFASVSPSLGGSISTIYERSRQLRLAAAHLDYSLIAVC